MIDYLAAFLLGLVAMFRRERSWNVPIDDTDYVIPARTEAEARTIAFDLHRRLR